MRRKKLATQKKIIITSSMCLLLCLCVGYASFSTTLSLTAKGNIKKKIGIKIEELKALAVTSGDGLYADEYETGRYFYKGTNPNNYITFNNETWRIISVEADNSIKIIRNESIGDKAWDNTNSNNWATPSNLNTYLNGEYLNSIITNKDKIKTDAMWNIAKIKWINTDLAGQIVDEKANTWQGSIALPTVSEYLRVNNNYEQCKNFSLNNTNCDKCKKTNWMFNIEPSNNYLWLISPSGDNVYIVDGTGSNAGSVNSRAVSDARGVAPTLYLTSNIALTGTGESGDPYIIN